MRANKQPNKGHTPTMTYQQAYDQAIAMGQVQAAKVFKKLMKAELAQLEEMCQATLPVRASAKDYAALDELCRQSPPSLALDAWGNAA
jgi:hypothetical protein